MPVIEATPHTVDITSFNEARFFMNYGSSEGEDLQKWEEELRASSDIFADALTQRINPPEGIGEGGSVDDTPREGKNVLLVAGGGDGTILSAAKIASKIGATLLIGGYGNGNNAGQMYNGRKYRKHPERLLAQGRAIVRTVHLMEMLVEYDTRNDETGEVIHICEEHLALTSMGYGRVAQEAKELDAARKKSGHKRATMRKLREYRQAKISANSIKHGEGIIRVQPIDESGKDIHVGPEGEDGYPHRFVVSSDWCRGFMTKYVFLPVKHWSDAAARRIDLERPEVLPEWLYAIQRGKHKTEALERYAPERVRILDATCGHTDGEGFHIPAGSVVTTRISEKTVKIIASIDPKLRPPRIPLRAHLAAAIGSLPTSVQLRNEFVQDINNIKHAVTFLFGKFRASSAPDELKKSKNTAA